MNKSGVKNRVKSAQALKGLCQGELAARLGMSQGAFSSKLGEKEPDRDLLAKIARELEVSADWLEYGEEVLRVVVDSGAFTPTRAHEDDAGLDLYAPLGCEETLFAQDSLVIDTGVHILIPRGYVGLLKSKSGLNVNHSIMSDGGVIDAGYTGSIRVKMYNHGTEPYRVKAGDKITQLIIVPVHTPRLEIVSELPATERGEAGFGSTGR